MRIYVCIPSFNEAQTISQVTGLIDQGLLDFSLAYGQPLDAAIINIDSASTDGTSGVFRDTNTHFPKQSMVLPEPRGKGRNLLAFAELAHTDKATHCITVDADIRSMTPAWIATLLAPLVSGRADFVSPSYERSQFEGSTTNHFAYPIVLTATGKHVRQPIAGDFAFTRELLEIIVSALAPVSANYYGIDIYLTLLALTQGLRHEQVNLGQKVHNPSFHKLEYMFPQIASTVLFMFRQMRFSKTLLQDDALTDPNIIPTAKFAHREAAKAMRERAQAQLRHDETTTWGWVPTHVFQKSEILDQGVVHDEDWIAILMAWLRFGLQNSLVNPDLLAEQLLPFFVLRATSFWFSSEQMTPEKVESEIKRQTRMLYIQFQNYLPKAT